MYNLCCISNELKEDGVAFKTMTWKRFTQLCSEHGDEYALDQLGHIWLNNIYVSHECIYHCHKNGWGYRVSSALFPVLTHPDFKYDIIDVPQVDQIIAAFDDIKHDNKHWKVRLSTHPDQFVVLASENQDAVDKSIKELNHHGWIMDCLGCERGYYNPINIHVNCSKGDLADIAARFMSNLYKCHESVISRLVVENEDRGCWTVGNLLEHFDIPITYDNLHDECNASCSLPQLGHQELDALSLCVRTWGLTKPLFHYSESHPEKGNPRAHADLPVDSPASLCYYDIDWDIELKSKDAAIRACAAIELTQQAQELNMGY